MDERIVPTIVLILNLFFYIFIIATVEFTVPIGLWGIILSVSLIVVAYQAYENAKKSIS